MKNRKRTMTETTKRTLRANRRARIADKRSFINS